MKLQRNLVLLWTILTLYCCFYTTTSTTRLYGCSNMDFNIPSVVYYIFEDQSHSFDFVIIQTWWCDSEEESIQYSVRFCGWSGNIFSLWVNNEKDRYYLVYLWFGFPFLHSGKAINTSFTLLASETSTNDYTIHVKNLLTHLYNVEKCCRMLCGCGFCSVLHTKTEDISLFSLYMLCLLLAYMYIIFKNKWKYQILNYI